MSAKKTSEHAVASNPPAESHSFQAETRQVLHLMIHSLYSNKEIFLRELISNASDALDRLRFAGLQDASLLEGDTDLRIHLAVDRDAGTLTIQDNGIGMSYQDVMENIGTIAKSGTRQFLDQLSSDEKANAQLIGQFGVGFYSAFVVADKVTVLTRKAGEAPEQGVRWTSDGGGEFQIQHETIQPRGTTIILQIKSAEEEFLERWTIRSLVNRYSDHIGFPIKLLKEPKSDDLGDDDLGDQDTESGPEWEQVNDAQALWTLPKSEISDEQYQAFYKSLSHDLADPLSWAHNRVEGSQSYTTLLYLPRKAQLDLMLQRDERHGVRLYSNRVFIMDAAQSLLPHYLRFVRGVVDSQDLPLNVSRELLQENELVGKIRAAVIRRSLDMIARISRDEPETYVTFWEQFGAVLKEGVVEDTANRERILELMRFSSTQDESTGARTSLAEYVARMKAGQECIFYITAEHHTAAKNSPHLEVFRRKGIEVLLMSDRVDEWMMSYLHEFEGKAFKSVTKGDIDLTAIAADEQTGAEEGIAQPESELDDALLGRIGAELEDRVGAVKSSHRLTDSASCLVLSENEMALHMQKMLRQAGQDIPESKPTLELNPAHPMVVRLAGEKEPEQFNMLALLLFEQALLAEGGSLPDPAGFVRRINTLMAAVPSSP